MRLWHGEETMKDSRLTAGKSEPGGPAVPVSLQCVRQGCRQTRQSAGGQVSIPYPHPSHLSTLCPELTNVPPVVGVPSTLVVGKAQLHLNTVGRTQSRAWSQWEGQPCPISHSCARQRELRTLWGESQEQNWGVYKAVVTSLFLEVTSGETEAQGTGFV